MGERRGKVRKWEMRVSGIGICRPGLFLGSCFPPSSFFFNFGVLELLSARGLPARGSSRGGLVPPTWAHAGHLSVSLRARRIPQAAERL